MSSEQMLTHTDGRMEAIENEQCVSVTNYDFIKKGPGTLITSKRPIESEFSSYEATRVSCRSILIGGATPPMHGTLPRSAASVSTRTSDRNGAAHSTFVGAISKANRAS